MNRLCARRIRTRWSVALAVGTALVAAAADPADLKSPDPAVRRAAVLDLSQRHSGEALRLLADRLGDENAVVRRAAARGLRDLGKPAVPVLTTALSHTDPEVRMVAFLGLNDQGALSVDRLGVALKDRDNVAMRQCAADILARMPLDDEIRALLQVASKDESDAVRETASRALFPFPFFRKVESVRDHADNLIKVVQTVALPTDGWRLKFDPQQNGHVEKWFDPGLPDSDWTAVSIGKFWDDVGFKAKAGIGWYRGRMTLPEKPVLSAAELCFDAVDETAWVWVNGEYAGQHDIGPNGWDVPFRLDVTPFLKWGQENQVTVRVLNTAQAGGIWKPVTLEVLRVGN